MRFAYADPPYLGCGKLYAKLHPEAHIWDDPETHRVLVARLSDEFEAWALSLHQKSLKTILNFCPDDIRVGAWIKPFCSFKPGVPVAYAWEPVIFRGGRKRSRAEKTVRDYVSAPITFKRGVPGAKPDQFCWWVFDLLGADPDDDFADLFPGSGAVGRAWEVYRRGHHVAPLFASLPA